MVSQAETIEPEHTPLPGDVLEVDALLMTEPDVTADKRHYLGPIKLGKGIKPSNVWAYAYVGLLSVCVTNFFSLMQPHILQERLHLGKELLGRTGGQLALTQNAAIFVFTIIFGALSDRVRGNRFLAFAYTGMAIACFLYPLGSSLPVLMATIFLLGIAQTITLTAGAAHAIQYPDNASRGTYGSVMSVFNLGGVMLIAAQFGPRLPTMLVHAGVAPENSLRYAFWTFGLIVLPGSIAAIFFLKQDPPVVREGRLDLKHEVVTIGRNLRDVLKYARINKRFQLVMLTALFMRSDFAVVTTFLSLWVVSSGRALGIDTSASVKHAGQLYSVVLAMTFVGMFVMGLLLDRINRVILLISALTLVTCAYMGPLLVHDVFAFPAYISAAFIGLAEGCIVITLSALLGQEAPAHLRGATVGIFNLIAIIGVALVNYLGGMLFDKVSHVAPFAMIAVFNLLTLLRALPFLKHRHGAEMEAAS